MDHGVDTLLSREYGRRPPGERIDGDRHDHSVERTTRLCLPTTHTKEGSMSQTLLAMAKDLVMAQMQAQRLSPDEMHTVIQQIYASLKVLQAQEDAHGRVAVRTPQTL